MSTKADHEILLMQRIMRELATLPPEGRQRVLSYVVARADSLPVIAAVGGGTEDEPVPMLPLLPDRNRERTDAAA